MSRKVHILTGKDSPLVKELYALLANNEIPLDMKPSEFCNGKADQFGHIDTNCFCNAFNKAKNMAKNDNPPPGISKYSGASNNEVIVCMDYYYTNR